MRELPGLQIIPPGVEDQQTNCNNQGYALPTHNNQYSLANTRRKDNEGDCSHRKLYRDPHIDKDVNREIADAFDEMVSEEPSDADSIVVVLDAANIAFAYNGNSHGQKNQFSAKGILIAVRYFQSVGVKDVKAFLPAKYHHGKRDAKEILDKLIVEKVLSIVPSGEADDPYIITHARDHNGFVVSNDRFRDHIESMLNESVKKSLGIWLDDNRCGYTFVRDEFMVNPMSELHKTTTRLLEFNDHEKMQIVTAPSSPYHSQHERREKGPNEEDQAALVALNTTVDSLLCAGRYLELKFVLLARASMLLELGRKSDAFADLTALLQKLDPQNAEARAMLTKNFVFQAVPINF